MIERKILIGFIISTEFNQRLKGKWNPVFFESSTAKRLASWVKEYFDKYNKAPGKDIESIFYSKSKKGLPKELVDEIEQDILPSLSEEYEQEDFNLEYYTEKAINYFNTRNLLRFSDEIKGLINDDKLKQAENLALSFKNLMKDDSNCIDLSNKSIIEEVKKAFTINNDILIEYPGQLGVFWNDQMVRGGFVALMGPEKRGKTWLLYDLARKGSQQGRKVAFFQAGDMTKEQQLRRICISLRRKSDKEKYIGKLLTPVLDCIHNQIDSCDKEERECTFGVLKMNFETVRDKITFHEIKEAYYSNKKYKNCFNCKEFDRSNWGTPYVKEKVINNTLSINEAEKAIETFFVCNKRSFKLSTHANGTLTINTMKLILENWEKQEGFVPDIIVIDYADLLVDTEYKEERHKQNAIWKGLRGLGQDKHCLMITATQTDSDSYSRDTLRLKNFSEDKRKYGHVTAMYGLNQDPGGREKELGVLRINELVLREDKFNSTNQIHILQDLRRGNPVIASYW